MAPSHQAKHVIANRLIGQAGRLGALRSLDSAQLRAPPPAGLARPQVGRRGACRAGAARAPACGRPRARRAGLRPISNLGAAMLLEFRLRGARGQRRRRVVRLALRASNPILHNSFQARSCCAA